MRYASTTQAILRIAASLLMLWKALPGLMHGIGIMLGLMTVLGILVLIGLFSRVAAAAAMVLMLAIYALFHAPQGLSPVDNGGVPAILSAAIFLHIAIAGPGRGSLDAFRHGRNGR